MLGSSSLHHNHRLTVSHHRYPPPQPNMEKARVGDKVRIYVDELGVLPDPRNKEPTRTLSLNRLNICERESSVEPLYKCPSFPRLPNHHHQPSCRRTPELTRSFTNNTDSISVQPSLENISGDPESGNVCPLPRCSSARMVGEGPVNNRLPLLTDGGSGGGGRDGVRSLTPQHQCPPQHHHPHHHPRQPPHYNSNRLSPATPSSMSNLVGRSTSCPSINHNKPASPYLPHNVQRHESGEGHTVEAEDEDEDDEEEDEDDIDLHGEVIHDLPINPSQNFPEFCPPHQLANASSSVVVSIERGRGGGGEGEGVRGRGGSGVSRGAAGRSSHKVLTRSKHQDHAIPPHPAPQKAGSFEEYPMHTRRIRDSVSSSIGPKHYKRSDSGGNSGSSGGGSPNKTTNKKKSGGNSSVGYINIRDIPSSIAQRGILEQDSTFIPEQMDKVQVKCIKWLNTLHWHWAYLYFISGRKTYCNRWGCLN